VPTSSPQAWQPFIPPIFARSPFNQGLKPSQRRTCTATLYLRSQSYLPTTHLVLLLRSFALSLTSRMLPSSSLSMTWPCKRLHDLSLRARPRQSKHDGSGARGAYRANIP
jgi:hypothetical protein